jgi:DNA-binding transcriptional regulator YiaG
MIELEQLRKAKGLTQAEAAALIYSARSSWQDWCRGKHRMPRALRELFIIKTNGSLFKVGLSELTAKEIKGYRRMAGLSISAAAKLVYVSQSTWSDWEAGRKRMRKGFLEFFILRIGLDNKKYG